MMKPETLSLQPVDVNPCEIRALLMRLGISMNYKGFNVCTHAVYLVTQNPDRMLFVSKWLYPDVAKHFGTTWRDVERNIRTASKIAWACNPDLVSELAGYPLTERPKAANFISMLAFRFLNVPMPED